MAQITTEKKVPVEPVPVEKAAVEKAPVEKAMAHHWRPMELMRRMLRWDPFEAMEPLRLWRDENIFSPDFSVKETKEALIFKADLPGVASKELNIQLAQNRLTVSGEREQEKKEEGETYYTYERSFGSFSRSFTLPPGADLEKVSAELKEGVLTIMVPKLPEAQAKKVEIKS